MPLSIIFVITIALNTMCLKNVDVAFYQVGRSLVTIFNVIFSWILLGEKIEEELDCLNFQLFNF